MSSNAASTLTALWCSGLHSGPRVDCFPRSGSSISAWKAVNVHHMLEKVSTILLYHIQIITVFGYVIKHFHQHSTYWWRDIAPHAVQWLKPRHGRSLKETTGVLSHDTLLIDNWKWKMSIVAGIVIGRYRNQKEQEHRGTSGCGAGCCELTVGWRPTLTTSSGAVCAGGGDLRPQTFCSRTSMKREPLKSFGTQLTYQIEQCEIWYGRYSTFSGFRLYAFRCFFVHSNA